MKALSFRIGSDLRIYTWSEELAHFTGKPNKSTIGKKYYEIFPIIYSDGKDALNEAVTNNKQLAIKEYRFPCLFAYVDADVEIRPDPPVDGSVRAAEITLFPSSTCPVAHKLKQSQKLINIGKIASTLAHGVRNPLNAIKGAVVYLSEKYQSEAPLVEFTKLIGDEISRLEDFITRFLSSSVSDTDVVETDINSLLKKIEVFISLQIYTKNIEALFDFGTVQPVTINSFHFEQAVLNVINNAIDAMENGGILRITTSSVERNEENFVAISVSDNGKGMQGSAIGELLPEKNKEGRGFGLFITYEILKHYGGHLEIDAQPHVGTTVKLLIPSQTVAVGVSHDRQQESSDR